jgi:predicted YcjX-like family ATPase
LSVFDDLSLALRNLAGFTGGLVNPSLRLGVTGLSRSGKTVFITAMVHALMAGARLPLFSAMGEGRIRRVSLAPQPDDAVPRFPYEDHLAALTGPLLGRMPAIDDDGRRDRTWLRWIFLGTAWSDVIRLFGVGSRAI